MNTKHALDLFRNNDLAFSFSQINYETHSIVIPFTYNDYFNTTFDFLIEALLRFENITLPPQTYNSFYLTIFTNLFSVLEQFISTTYELIYFYFESDKLPTEEENKKYFRQEYQKTLKHIFTDLEIDDTEFKKNAMYNKISDIANSRNYILHGNIGTIKIEKTHLPQSPLTINLEDIMEELDIIVNLMIHFRYIVPEVDLMPNIRIKYSSTIIFEKLDSYFYNVLVPYFERILKKHNLSKTREFRKILTSLPTLTSKALAKHINTFIKAKENKLFDEIQINNKETNYFNYYLLNIINPMRVLDLEDENLFELPNFKRTL